MKTREIRVIGDEFRPRIREVQEGDDDDRTIEGYAVVFGRESVLLCDFMDRYREIIEPGAITPELLAKSDIKMTLWHNRERLLARRNNGEGTLDVGIDTKGVWYRFSAPHTPDGDTALELVRRGDLAGSSFIYTADERNDVNYRELEDGTVVRHVSRINAIYDMTIASDPAYKDTEVSAREVNERLGKVEPKKKPQSPARIREIIKKISTKHI